MNTTAQALVFAIASVAAAAAIGTGLANHTAPATTEIVKLERVVVYGKRADAAQTLVITAKLPRVVVEGRSTGLAAEVQVAAAKPATQTL